MMNMTGRIPEGSGPEAIKKLFDGSGRKTGDLNLDYRSTLSRRLADGDIDELEYMSSLDKWDNYQKERQKSLMSKPIDDEMERMDRDMKYRAMQGAYKTSQRNSRLVEGQTPTPLPGALGR
jgi:hypothetical protein